MIYLINRIIIISTIKHHLSMISIYWGLLGNDENSKLVLSFYYASPLIFNGISIMIYLSQNVCNII